MARIIFGCAVHLMARTYKMEVIMLYQKNVPNWERVLRVVVAGIGAAYVYQAGFGWIATLAVASFSLSGFFGFCPMCAMVGRKLDQQSQNKEREPASKKI